MSVRPSALLARRELHLHAWGHEHLSRHPAPSEWSLHLRRRRRRHQRGILLLPEVICAADGHCSLLLGFLLLLADQVVGAFSDSCQLKLDIAHRLYQEREGKFHEAVPPGELNNHIGLDQLIAGVQAGRETFLVSDRDEVSQQSLCDFAVLALHGGVDRVLLSMLHIEVP